MTTCLVVSSLHVYPIKGCAGIALDTLELHRRGPRLDREWMVVDAARGQFVSQRNRPRLALARPRIQGESLVVRGPHTEQPLVLPLAHRARPPRPVTVWRDTLEALDEGDAAAAWFGALLGGPPVRLVRMPVQDARFVDPDYAPAGTPVGFADGFPLLVACSASLAALNAELVQPVPMDRFRPNLVLDGGEPWQEEGWRVLELAGVSLPVVKRCLRCKVVTIDQASATIPEPGEPLATLLRLRAPGGGGDAGAVYFGQNVLAAEATLRLGEVVTVA